MTIENGLDTPAVAELDRMLAAGELDERTTAYLTLTRSQSIGWMLHDKAVCNFLRISSFILRKVKAAVAKLPGIRRVRYVSHKGVEYDGLLLGDHAEGEGYKIVGWYDGDTYHPEPPPALVQTPEIQPFNPTDSPSPRARFRMPWTKRQDREKNINDEPAEQETAPEDRVTWQNSEKRVEVMAIRQARPDLAPGCALIEALLDHKNVPATRTAVEHWQGQVWSILGEFTAADAYEGVRRVHAAGKPLDHHWIIRGVEAARRTREEAIR